MSIGDKSLFSKPKYITDWFTLIKILLTPGLSLMIRQLPALFGHGSCFL